MDDARPAPDLADATNAEIESVLIPLLGRLCRKPDDSMLSHMLWASRPDGDPRPAEDLLPSLKVILLGRHARAGPRGRLDPARPVHPA